MNTLQPPSHLDVVSGGDCDGGTTFSPPLVADAQAPIQQRSRLIGLVAVENRHLQLMLYIRGRRPCS
jgi:hypothetical protein